MCAQKKNSCRVTERLLVCRKTEVQMKHFKLDFHYSYYYVNANQFIFTPVFKRTRVRTISRFFFGFHWFAISVDWPASHSVSRLYLRPFCRWCWCYCVPVYDRVTCDFVKYAEKKKQRFIQHDFVLAAQYLHHSIDFGCDNDCDSDEGRVKSSYLMFGIVIDVIMVSMHSKHQMNNWVLCFQRFI